ncbi:arpin isoform X2 [Budorcas taxicolor]|uniref:arpin isoform X2 n=1 Tax=Budorcas taxicolor TaxID=37181 RepID=UPI00228524CB|nr:arpin isoform X2 [Budorcas taxicolor]
MSRIYHDSALRNKAVRSARLPRAWDPAAHQRGDGVLLEGELLDVSRHSISDAHGRKPPSVTPFIAPHLRRPWTHLAGIHHPLLARVSFLSTSSEKPFERKAMTNVDSILKSRDITMPTKERYYVLYIRPSRIHRRKFDPKGNEIEPNFSATRKVNTGFLMSSYKVEAKGDSDRLTPEALKGLVNKPELLALTESLTPAETVAFWMPESEMEAMELELGAGVRLKTRGDGPFLDSLAKLEAGTVTKCNFAGDGKTGTSWTDNIMAQKSLEGALGRLRSGRDGVPPGPTGTIEHFFHQLSLWSSGEQVHPALPGFSLWPPWNILFKQALLKSNLRPRC